jgi:hypothetical protein
MKFRVKFYFRVPIHTKLRRVTYGKPSKSIESQNKHHHVTRQLFAKWRMPWLVSIKPERFKRRRRNRLRRYELIKSWLSCAMKTGTAITWRSLMRNATSPMSSSPTHRPGGSLLQALVNLYKALGAGWDVTGTE